MTAITTQQFIDGYLESPAKTMEWISNNSTELLTLFTTRDDIGLLARAYFKKLRAQTESVSMPMFGGYRTPEYQQQINELGKPIDELLNCSGARIASLYENNTQFMQLFDICPAFAKKLFAKEPRKIGILFVNHAHFMQLLDSDSSLPLQLFENEPERIGSFFETYDQFMQLHAKGETFAEKLFDSNPKKFAALFNTQSKFDLISGLNGNSSLGLKVAATRKALGLQFEEEAEAKESYESDYSPASSFSNTTSSTFNRDIFQPQLNRKYAHQYKPVVLISRPPKPNNNFCLKCFMGLALVGGVAAIIAGVLLAQPELLGVGVCVSVTAAISLFSLFTKKPAPNYDEPFYNARNHRWS